MRLIDSDALVKEMCNNGAENNCPCYPKCYPCDFSESRRMIEEQPTVDAVTVRHCRWIPKYQPPDPKASWSTEYYCSGCGHETHITVIPDQRDNYIDDYCGGCGARMDAYDINVLTKDGGADNDA